MTANAERAATAIATYLVEVGIWEPGDQIAAIRRQYAMTWYNTLIQHGFDNLAGMPVNDIAAGVDLAISRLLDEAQVIYDDSRTAHKLPEAA